MVSGERVSSARSKEVRNLETPVAPRSAGLSGKISKMPRPMRSSRRVIVAFRYASLAETIFKSGVKMRNRAGSDSNRLSNTALLRRSSSSTLLRSVMSRMAEETSIPSAVSSGLKLISVGNSEPSLRSPYSSMPTRTPGSAKKPPRCEGCRSRKRAGTNISTAWPNSSCRWYPNRLSNCVLTRTILPS